MTTIGKIADVICGPFGTAITNKDYVDNGVPLLRITNITKMGYLDYSDLKYIEKECANRLIRMQVTQGDIVISQRGTLGQCAIVDDKFGVCNISANLIAVKNIREVNAEFLRNYLLSPIGIALLQRSQSGQVQGKITTQDIADMPIPIVADANKLNSIISNAYQNYTATLRKADALLAGMDTVVLERLGIDLPKWENKLTFAVRRGDLLNSELYCRPSYPAFGSLMKALKGSRYYCGTLDNFVDVNPKTERTGLVGKQDVSFVPMTAVGNRDNTVEYETRKYDEVKSGYTIFKRGDLLWAKITPCMQNGKSCIVNKLPTEIGFGSTEFHVLRQRSDKIYMPYLWIWLASPVLLSAAQAVFNGSAGQQRVSDSFLKNLPLPLPDIQLQKELANTAFANRTAALSLKQQATEDWAAARAKFEKELLEG